MYPAVLSQSQSFQCQTPNPKMSWSLRKVRQSWLCQSLGSSLIQSNLEQRVKSELEHKLRRRLTIQPLCHLHPISSLPSCVHCGIPCRLLQSTTVCPTLTEISNMTFVLKERLLLTASRACRAHWAPHLRGGIWWHCSWRGPWTRPCPQGVPPWRRRGPQHQSWSLPHTGHQSKRTPQHH